mgnify:CR=1 FL=1
MDSTIYKKHTLLKTNINIWKTVWSIKNNTTRNEYINTLLIHFIKHEFIDLYYKDNLIIGMPRKKYEVYYDVYFNVYSLDFDIILYYTIDNIKLYSNSIYQNCQPEDIFLYLMQSSIIKQTRLLNTLLQRLNNYKAKWAYYLHYLIKQITLKYNLNVLDNNILAYLMEHTSIQFPIPLYTKV